MTTMTSHALKLTRRIHAPRERVFRAWTEPKELQRWCAPPGFTIPEAEVDLRVGGRYRIQMQAPDGRLVTAHGTYREISPPERLVFTWAWDPPKEGELNDTVVSVELTQDDAFTVLVLRHEGFPSEDARANHEKGWSGCLPRLDELFA